LIHPHARLKTKLRRLQLWELLDGTPDSPSDKIAEEDDAVGWTQSILNTMINNIQVGGGWDADSFPFSLSPPRIFAAIPLLAYFSFCSFNQIFVNRVHIRFEDDSDPSQPFAFGMSLKYLHAQTTNDKVSSFSFSFSFSSSLFLSHVRNNPYFYFFHSGNLPFSLTNTK